MTVDWTKPIQFKNGEACELTGTNPEGWTQFGARPDGAYPTREIHRLNIDESSTGGLMSAYWHVHEDGQPSSSSIAELLGYEIINIPEA